MGDPRKNRKKYTTPSHPWQKDRIDIEKTFIRDYGLKNKKEIWKMESFLKSLFAQTKKVIREQTKQSEIEKQQLMDKVFSLGLLEKGSQVQDVLSLTLKDILGRRLQTLVLKKNLARSIKQSRQFISHKHIFIGDRSMTVPSYLVTIAEEAKIQFRPTSALSKDDHPERAPPEDSAPKNESKKSKKEGKKPKSEDKKDSKKPKGSSKEKDNSKKEEKKSEAKEEK